MVSHNTIGNGKYKCMEMKLQLSSNVMFYHYDENVINGPGVAGAVLGMGVKDIFKSRQLSSQIFFHKSCQGNCQVNCASTNFLQGNCQVNSFPKIFVKAIVKSNVLPKKFFNAFVKSIIWWKIIYFFRSIIVIFCLILVNYGSFWSIIVNYR